MSAENHSEQLVDIGGYALAIRCMGHGAPVVVIDAGLGDGLNTWTRTQARVATFTQVCVYDRAGVGQSDRGPAPRTSPQMVAELRAGGYADDTPVVVAHRTSWPDELTLRCRLDEVEAVCKRHKLWRHTLVLVGAALGASGTRSHLYHAGHFHTFRKPDKEARRELRATRRTS